MPDSDDHSRNRDSSQIYLPPPPVEGLPDQVRVPRVNPPSPSLESYVRPRTRRGIPRLYALSIAFIAVVAAIVALGYLYR